MITDDGRDETFGMNDSNMNLVDSVTCCQVQSIRVHDKDVRKRHMQLVYDYPFYGSWGHWGNGLWKLKFPALKRVYFDVPLHRPVVEDPIKQYMRCVAKKI